MTTAPAPIQTADSDIAATNRSATMWFGWSVAVWETIFFWVTAAAALAGAISVSAAFASAIIGFKISDEVTRQASIEIANANERAANAQLETERIRERLASRKLTPEQISKLETELKKLGGKIFLVGRDEDEPRQYADQFVTALRAAGAYDGYALTSSPANRWSGIRLYLGNLVAPDKLWSDPFAVAFSKAGIPVAGLSSGRQSGVVIDPQLQRSGQRTVYVGFKPLND